MKDLPLTTIITPSLNQGRYIKTTIDSVLSQDYFNIEYMVMDGGSTDETIDVLKGYGNKFFWISEPDKGQSDAINKGLKRAKGEIVAWLNADDYYLPGAVRKIVEAFQKEPHAAMVYGDGYFVNKRGEMSPGNVEPFFDLWKMIHLYDFILQPSVFINKKTLIAAGLIDTNLHYIMDWDLWIRLAREEKIIYLPDKLSCARIYPEAKTSSGGAKRWKEIIMSARRYGNFKVPPALFIHIPADNLKNSDGRYTGIIGYIANIVKFILIPLTFGGNSGVYQDGYVAKRGFLSIPLISDISILTLKIDALINGEMCLRINKIDIDTILLDRDFQTIEIPLKSELKKREFLHIEFRSNSVCKLPPTHKYQYARRAAFRLMDISLIDDKGEAIKNIGLPNFDIT